MDANFPTRPLTGLLLRLLYQHHSEDIHAAAVEQGMIDLRHYAAWLLTEGLTTVEELLRVTRI